MRFLCLILLTVFCLSQMAFSQNITTEDDNSQQSTEQTAKSKKSLEPEEPKPIFELIAAGEVDEVKKLLRDSVDYYNHNTDGETALTIAIKNDDVDMVKLLVKEAVINLKNKEGETPLTLAIKKGNYEIIRLVCRRAKGSLKNDFGETPLYLAVESEDLFLVEELIRKGADVNRRSNGITPLAHATELNNFKAVGYLLKEGAIANRPNDNGDIPLYIAIDNGFDIVAGILINKSADAISDVNWRTKIDETLLNIAIVKSHPEIVKILLNAGANFITLDYFENSALHIAAKEGNIEITSILINHGVEINARNLKGETPLMLAAKASKRSTVQYLIDQGADPNLKDYQGYCVSSELNLSPSTGQQESSNQSSILTNYKQTGNYNNEQTTSSIYIENNQ